MITSDHVPGYGLLPRVKNSHSKTPNDQQSDLEEKSPQ